MTYTCSYIQGKLVAYSDDELPIEEMSEVERHLNQCYECNRLCKALHQSLAVATEFWDDGLRKTASTPAYIKLSHMKSQTKFSVTYAAAIAAAVLVILGLLSQYGHKPISPHAHKTLKQIERKIEIDVRASVLLSATEILAEMDGYRTFVTKHYQQIIELFPETSAAETATNSSSDMASL